MTPEEIRFDCFDRAWNQLCANASRNAGAPNIADVVALAMEIEKYIFLGVNPFAPTLTTVSNGIVGNLTLSGGTPSISNNVPKPTPPASSSLIPKKASQQVTIAPPRPNPQQTMVAHSLMVAIDDNEVQALMADGMDILQHIKDHINDFHRVHHGASCTQDFTIQLAQTDVQTDPGGDTLISYVYLVDIATRP